MDNGIVAIGVEGRRNSFEDYWKMPAEEFHQVQFVIVLEVLLIQMSLNGIALVCKYFHSLSNQLVTFSPLRNLTVAHNSPQNNFLGSAQARTSRA